MIRASTRSRNTSSPLGGRIEAQDPVGRHSPSHRWLICEARISNGSPSAPAGQPQIQHRLTRRQPLGGGGLQRRQLGLVVGRTECSIERDPRREDHTICTAVAPEAVFTVRT